MEDQKEVSQHQKNFGNRIISIFGILATSFIITGCATTQTEVISENHNTNNVILTKPSERVAIKYEQKNTQINESIRKELPAEVIAFLNDGIVDENKLHKITPTKIGRGSYNHDMLNNAKATDIVAIDPTKMAPPLALPDYGSSEEILQKPVDFVAQAPAYFASNQVPEEPTYTVSRTKSYASVKTSNRRVVATFKAQPTKKIISKKVVYKKNKR